MYSSYETVVPAPKADCGNSEASVNISTFTGSPPAERSKAPSPTVSSCDAMATDLSPEQPWKASEPMVVTDAGISTVVRESADSKAPAEIVTVPSGTENSADAAAEGYLTRVLRSFEYRTPWTDA